LPWEDKDDPIAQDVPNAGVGPVLPERPARAAMMQEDSRSNGAAAWSAARTWCYVNLADGAASDAAWWTAQWRRFSVQGVVLPAGDGAEGLRPLTTLAQAARAAGLAVLASMTVRPLTREDVAANPAWVARDDKGEPIAVDTGYSQSPTSGRML